jgi:hypothetical protein
MANQTDYVWGAGHVGVQFAIKVRRVPGSAAEPLEVVAAVRNPGSQPVTYKDVLALAIDTGTDTRYHLGGPHSDAEFTLEPGEVREIRSWRVHDHGLSPRKRGQIWLTHRDRADRPALSNVMSISMPR